MGDVVSLYEWSVNHTFIALSHELHRGPGFVRLMVTLLPFVRAENRSEIGICPREGRVVHSIEVLRRQGVCEVVLGLTST